MPKLTPAQMKAAIEEFKKKFTGGFYHGSPSNKIKAFDPDKGSKPEEWRTPGVTFVTRDPEFAESFLPGSKNNNFKTGATMYPVSVNLGKHWHPNTEEGKATIQNYLDSTTREYPSKGLLNRADWTEVEHPTFLDHLRNEGYNTFHVMEGGIPNVGVFDPKNIRGKFAKYNPKDAESPNFMKAEGGPVQHYDGGGKVGNILTLLKKLGLSEESIAAWKAANSINQRQTRNPLLQQAAKDLAEGKITSEQYRALARTEMPIRAFTEVPNMPTQQDIANALKSNQLETGIVGVNKNIAPGSRVSSRLDIPAYDKYDKWIVSLHDPLDAGKSIGYGQTAHLKGPIDFTAPPKAGHAIATGKSDKTTYARIHGDWEPTNPEDVYKRAQDLMDDPQWAQVGLNPFRHSYFYDKADMAPVVAGEEALQVGPLVLVKKPQKVDPDDPRFRIAKDKPETFAPGGKVVSGLEALVKKLMPQAERDANKAKFLEGNHPIVPNVVYHATREAPKGQAIEQMIGSKYGTLGSGTYTTPDTKFGSTYTGIPTPETIEELKISFPAMARPYVKGMEEGDWSGVPMGGYMMPLHPSVKNPLILEGIHPDPAFEALAKLGVPDNKIDSIVEKANEKYGSIGKEIQSRAQKAGHDAVILFKNGNLQEMVTYSPNQLKSAIGNEGTFNPYDPRLSKKNGGSV